MIYIFIGIFGFIGISIALIPLNYIKVPPPFADNSRGTLEATEEALIQIGSNSQLLIAVIGQSIIFQFFSSVSGFYHKLLFGIAGIAFSIAFFNYAGISITKEMSATTRMILDSVRTIVIWIFSLLFQWQVFHYMQV